jgi:hypothetical protein
MKAFHPRQFAGIVIIEQDFSSLNFFCQQNGADFAKAQRIIFLGRKQLPLIPQRLHFNPRGVRNFRCSGQSCSCDNHFIVNFRRDVNVRIRPTKEVKAAKLGQNYPR